MNNKIYQKDVNDFLKLTKKKYDLIIADPPYNQNVDKWDSFSYEEYWKFMKSWISKVEKRLNVGGAIWIFNNPFNSALTIPILVKSGLKFQNWITWYKKDGFSPSKKKFRTMQETILFFTKGNEAKNFNLENVRTPYMSKSRIEAAKKKGIVKNGRRWFPNPNGALRSDVWEFTSQRHKTKIAGKTMKQDHATPKPHDIIELIIRTHAFPEIKILDLFSGSGTTSIVAKKLGYDSDGVEINKKYVINIKNKLRND